MATVRLYGDLERFGREFTLLVKTPSEALRALMSQIQGFKGAFKGRDFHVRIDDEELTEEEFKTRAFHPIDCDSTFHIMPVITGAGSTEGWGLFGVIAGGILMVAGMFTMNPWIFMAGVTLMTTGSLLMAPKEVDTEETDNGPRNRYLRSLNNNVAQGSCVPLAYGELLIGSKVLSQGISTG
jgi:predicted phage tail protein